MRRAEPLASFPDLTCGWTICPLLELAAACVCTVGLAACGCGDRDCCPHAHKPSMISTKRLLHMVIASRMSRSLANYSKTKTTGPALFVQGQLLPELR